MANRDIPLPQLRPDLQFFIGPIGYDGSPTYTLYDPLARTFDKVGWSEMAVLERLGSSVTLGELLADLQKNTTVQTNEEEVLCFCRDLLQKGMTKSTPVMSVEKLEALSARKKGHPIKRMLQNYLFFRIPLIRPEKFLKKTSDTVVKLAAKPALLLYLALFLAGLFMFLERMHEYFHTFQYFFNLRGILLYAAVIIALKMVHELSHAYTATRYGVRVPVMGVGFMVFWPVAYCDVTDAWKLADRRQRLAIGLAGIMSEGVIAAIALFGWCITAPGTLNSIFFVISSVSFLSTLIVNLNPGMRFDGYFVLMDLSGIDNLQSRAFEVTRWTLRKVFLGIDLPPPEEGLRPQRKALMVCYSLYTWTYRFFLYIAIGLLVYHKFTKVLGIFLLTIELWWFIMGPIIREVKTLINIRKNITLNARIFCTSICLLSLVLWFSLPRKQTISAPAVVVATDSQTVYAPYSGRVVDIDVELGADVSKGDRLLTIISPELNAEIRLHESEKKIVEKQKETLLIAGKDIALIPEKNEELLAVTSKLTAMRLLQEKNILRAEVSGKVYEWDNLLAKGHFVAKDAVLGRIADLNTATIFAFVSEDDLAEIAIGDEVVFYSDADLDSCAGRVFRISPVRTETMKYLALSSAPSGDLPLVEDASGRQRMLESRYAIEINPINLEKRFRIGQSGSVKLKTSPRSWFLLLGRKISRLLIRESNL